MFKFVGKKEINGIIAGLRNKNIDIKTLSAKVLHEIGKRIILVNYDGYNYISTRMRMTHFNNLDRWQKESFVQKNLFRLSI